MIQFKKLIYLTWQMLLKNIWRLSGGRRTNAKGLALNLHPDTVWPGRRGLRLPREDCRSKIVAFADHVQAHALCNAVESSHRPKGANKTRKRKIIDEIIMKKSPII